MVTPRSGDTSATSGRSGIDQYPIDDLVLARLAPTAAAILAALAEERPKWQRRAACRGVDPEVFLPTTAAGKARAFDYCGRCEVRDTCLDWALDVGDFTAVLGGHDGASRRRLAKARDAALVKSLDRLKENPDAST